jgi:Ino eighty subunit 1
MVYHYLEDPTVPNPFADQFANQHPGKAPLLRKISKTEKARENVDTREEIEWGKKMSAERNMFLQKLVSQTEMDKKPRAPYFISG